MKDIRFRYYSILDDDSKGMVTDDPYFEYNCYGFKGILARDTEYAIMQFIGLTDCKNQDIYEEDILMDIHDGSIWVVKYFDEYASFGIYEVKNDSNSALMFQIDVKDYKVIGNVYENPSLLETDDGNKICI